LDSLDYTIVAEIFINKQAKKYMRITRDNCNHLAVFCKESFIDIIDLNELKVT